MISRSGGVLFDGAPMTGLYPRDIAARGGVQVAQGRFVLPGMTLLENLQLRAVTRKNKAEIQRSPEEGFALLPTLARKRSENAAQLGGG